MHTRFLLSMLGSVLLAACGEQADPEALGSSAAKASLSTPLMLSAASPRALTGRDYRLEFQTFQGAAVDLSDRSFDLFAMRVGGYQQNLLEPRTEDGSTWVVVRPPEEGDAMVGCSTIPSLVDGVMTSYHLKTLFFCASNPSAVPTPSAALSYRLGQQLEIVPMVDPLPLLPGDDLPVQVRFDGPELGDAEVVLHWRADRSSDSRIVFRGRTDQVGTLDLPLAKDGQYLVAATFVSPGPNGDPTKHQATMGFALGEMK